MGYDLTRMREVQRHRLGQAALTAKPVGPIGPGA
jgi:hypothetical protein